MSGQWPPEWDDPEDIPGEADQQDAEAETGLSEVAAYLASVPAPAMPGSVEARISAALAVESAARAGLAATASGDAKGDGTAQSPGSVQAAGSLKPDSAAGARVLGPAPARARVRRDGRQERRRQRDLGKIFEPRRQRDAREVLGKFVIGPLAVCLLIVIIALGLSHAGSSSSSSSAASGGVLGAAAPNAAAASSAPAGSSRFGKSNAASGAQVTAAPASSAAAPAFSAAASASASAPDFTVIQTGTSYQEATLAQQTRDQVLAARARESAPASVPSASSSSTSSSAITSLSGSAPTAQLRACVLKVTGGVLPELVDRATYQGTLAYVIASSSRVWVVGLGCTAARPQVIVSVPLAA